MKDFDSLHTLLQLSRELAGFPSLSSIKRLVDAELNEREVDSRKEVADLDAKLKADHAKAAADKAKADKDAEDQAPVEAKPNPATTFADRKI